MKTRKLYKISCWNGDICEMAGWGKTIPEAIKEFRVNVLKESLQLKSNIEKESDFSFGAKKLVKHFEALMEEYLNGDHGQVFYEVYNESWNENNEDWITEKSSNFNMKYPMKLTF